jgi:HAMP domain-containing protein
LSRLGLVTLDESPPQRTVLAYVYEPRKISRSLAKSKHQQKRGIMKIRWKIDLAMSGAFLVGLGLAGFVAYQILSKNAQEDSLLNARIIMEEASAIRSYTAESIRPLLEQQMKVQFLPHSIPSFAAQTNFKLVRQKLPDYTYREPTLNPTNLNDRAIDWEADIINGFRDDSSKQETLIARDTPGGQFLVLARPLKIGSQACLTCHSTPDAAPATMVALYGSQNGFGWKLGEVVGAQVVSIPLGVPLSRAYKALLWFMLALAGTFVLIIIMVDLLLRAIVVKPVVEISEMADSVSMGNLETPEYVRDSGDEIGSLSTSFNRMRRSLQNAMKMLDEHS